MACDRVDDDVVRVHIGIAPRDNCADDEKASALRTLNTNNAKASRAKQPRDAIHKVIVRTFICRV